MKDTDIEGIERFLDEMKGDIENNNVRSPDLKRGWLLSQAIVTGNSDLLVLEGIFGISIKRFKLVVELLETAKKGGKIEGKEAEELRGKVRDVLANMLILSKDYLRNGDKIKFFDSIAQDSYTLQEIKETMRFKAKE